MTISLAFRDLLGDANVRFVAKHYQDEMPQKPHKRGGVKSAGEFTAQVARILDDHYILWLRTFDPETGLPALTHKRPVEIGDPDEFVMPIREAVKRLRGSRGEPPSEQYRWLRAVLAWRGLPCMCNCADIVAHIAMIERTHPAEVRRVVLEAARRVVEEIRRSGSIASGLPAPRRAEPMRLRRRTSELPDLPRTYWPCGCTERSACAPTRADPCVREP